MFELNTERLKIIPLNIEQFKLYGSNPAKLDEQLGLVESHTEKYDDEMEREIGKVLDKVLQSMEKNPYNSTWFTMWQIILKEENKIIGTCGFSGLPDSEGKIEIGYALKPKYQKKGFMPEAMREMIRFAFMHNKVRVVIAQTPENLLPSQKLLQAFNFEQDFVKDGIITWNLKNPNSNN